MEQPSQSETEAAQARRAAFMSAIPSELAHEEDNLPKQIGQLNAASHGKLHRVYQVAEKLSRFRAPFVACQRAVRPAAT